MTELLYTPEHQWLRLDDAASGLATVGITPHAQDALGDIVFVRCPEIGQTLARNDVAAVIESVKAAADVYMPVDGYILQTNQDALQADPALLNTDPLGAGWLFQIRLTRPEQVGELLSEAAYQALLKGG